MALPRGDAGWPDAPPAQARAVSEALSGRIAARIGEAGGWIGFDRYMQYALYEPGFGYYGGSNVVFGPAGDFVTAPQMSMLFGQCVAVQCAQWLERTGGAIVEFGAGDGSLAAQVLTALANARALPAQYAIIELSASLRERQKRTIAGAAPHCLDRVRWLDELPGSIEGVVLANEVLDAMPVRVFRFAEDRVFEQGVTHGGNGRFAWSLRAADGEFAARVRRRLQAAAAHHGTRGGDFAPASTAPAVVMQQPYVSELGEQAGAWVESVGSRLARGAMLLIDYGFPRHEFYHPQRAGGTLRCHYRHRAHDDPFLWPGLQDITAHVDFTAVAAAGVRAGLDVLGYTSQARFLLDCGLIEAAMAIPRADPRRWTRETAAVQRLLSEAEMGELFKVIALGRGLDDDATGFRTRDRRDSLAVTDMPTGEAAGDGARGDQPC